MYLGDVAVGIGRRQQIAGLVARGVSLKWSRVGFSRSGAPCPKLTRATPFCSLRPRKYRPDPWLIWQPGEARPLTFRPYVRHLGAGKVPNSVRCWQRLQVISVPRPSPGCRQGVGLYRKGRAFASFLSNPSCPVHRIGNRSNGQALAERISTLVRPVLSTPSSVTSVNRRFRTCKDFNLVNSSNPKSVTLCKAKIQRPQ